VLTDSEKLFPKNGNASKSYKSVVGLGFQWLWRVLLFGPLLRTPGGASVIWPCAALGHVLLLGRKGVTTVPIGSEGRALGAPVTHAGALDAQRALAQPRPSCRVKDTLSLPKVYK